MIPMWKILHNGRNPETENDSATCPWCLTALTRNQKKEIRGCIEENPVLVGSEIYNFRYFLTDIPIISLGSSPT